MSAWPRETQPHYIIGLVSKFLMTLTMITWSFLLCISTAGNVLSSSVSYRIYWTTCIITFKAVYLCPHSYAAPPGDWSKAEILRSYWWIKVVPDNSVCICISTKNLEGQNCCIHKNSQRELQGWAQEFWWKRTNQFCWQLVISTRFVSS